MKNEWKEQKYKVQMRRREFEEWESLRKYLVLSGELCLPISWYV